MQQESLLPLNPLTDYFLSELPDKWNILKWKIHFALDGRVFCTGDCYYQVVSTRMNNEGFMEGFMINMN